VFGPSGPARVSVSGSPVSPSTLPALAAPAPLPSLAIHLHRRSIGAPSEVHRSDRCYAPGRSAFWSRKVRVMTAYITQNGLTRPTRRLPASVNEPTMPKRARVACEEQSIRTRKALVFVWDTRHGWASPRSNCGQRNCSGNHDFRTRIPPPVRSHCCSLVRATNAQRVAQDGFGEGPAISVYLYLPPRFPSMPTR
jgi:hypothetical protein